ncbi:MAG: ABC transporter permease subunit [Candidatus Hydrogenedentes bacterium]|nr:ABC transporter permease subunit [Candidatus Hydrogenedentota bacterium]
MRNTWAVCKREFSSFFVTPVGYVVVATFAAISGAAFSGVFTGFCKITQSPNSYGYEGIPNFEELMLSPYLVFCGQLILFIGPLITMRLLAEERNRGTLELLLTHPLRDREIIFGKYLASLGIVLVLMMVVGVHMVLMARHTEVEPVVLVFGLLTVFLMSAAFMSLGLFVSSVTGNQITAGTLTFGLWFVSYILGTYGSDLPPDVSVPANWGQSIQLAANFFYHIFRQLVVQLPLDAHAQEMAQGALRPKDIAYYVLFSSFFLFLTFRSLEARRWRA